jgi:glycosyltransferase involved in cell wall biosynthesis
MPKGVLFIHNNFPGQFRDLAQTLQARNVPICAVSQIHGPGLPGVYIARYKLSRSSTPDLYKPAVRAEADLIRAFGALKGMERVKADGFDPQVIVAHPGWGEVTHSELVFPNAKQVHLAEFFYHGRGFDVGFDPEFGETDEETLMVVEAKNMAMALAYSRASAIVSPTEFQKNALPPAFRQSTQVIHEGVDVEAIAALEPAPFELPDGRVLAPGTPVITHINNQMEPLRGLHIFARALPRLLAEVPNAHVIVIGEEKKAGYGGAAPDDRTWKQFAFEPLEGQIDPSRVHFLGRVPHAQMLAALQISSAHVYYSYPFVLSWSLCEAMASGCYVIGSDTAPLHDAITDGANGKLLPFFDVEALSEAMIQACRTPGAFRHLRAAARETALEKFSRIKGRAAWLDLLREHGVEIPT